MSKKSIAFLVFAIIFFVLAVGVFVYSKVSLNKNTSLEEPESNAQTAEPEKEEEFIFYNEKDEEFKISDFDGKPIALILWSSDTDNSFEIIEMVEKIYSDYKDKVNFLVINTEEKTSDITETVANCGYSFQVYYDKDNLASKYYEYEKLPTLIFFDADGKESNKIEEKISEDSFLANLDIIAENY